MHLYLYNLPLYLSATNEGCLLSLAFIISCISIFIYLHFMASKAHHYKSITMDYLIHIPLYSISVAYIYCLMSILSVMYFYVYLFLIHFISIHFYFLFT